MSYSDAAEATSSRRVRNGSVGLGRNHTRHVSIRPGSGPESGRSFSTGSRALALTTRAWAFQSPSLPTYNLLLRIVLYSPVANLQIFTRNLHKCAGRPARGSAGHATNQTERVVHWSLSLSLVESSRRPLCIATSASARAPGGCIFKVRTRDRGISRSRF